MAKEKRHCEEPTGASEQKRGPGAPRGPRKKKKIVPFEDLPEVMTVEEYAAFMRIDRNTAYDAVHNKKVPFFRQGRAIRILKRKLGIQLGYYDEPPKETVAS